MGGSAGSRRVLCCVLGLAGAVTAQAQPQRAAAADAAPQRLEWPAASSAQNPGAPLKCERAQVTVTAKPCPPGFSCQAGTTPGIAQKRGPAGQGVSGSATAFGPLLSNGQRSVNFTVLVPDVTDFAPTTLQAPRALQTELWVVKRASVPAGGVNRADIADHAVQVHNGPPSGVARIGTAQGFTDAGPMAGRVTSPWQVVGLVSARHGRLGKLSSRYGFVCELPVSDLPPPAR